MGLGGRIPLRVDVATESGLLELLDHAVEQGWTVRAACGVLELGEVWGAPLDRPPRLVSG